MPEKQNSANKSCPVDLAGLFGAPYVPSHRRDPRQCRRPTYEARETINFEISFRVLYRVSNFSVATLPLSTDIGGFGGQVPLIAARPDPERVY